MGDPLIGRTIGEKLKISRLLGIGGMGRVYLARHIPLDKDVAVKVLIPQKGVNPAEQAERFQREARAASRLDHVNAVQILDFGQDRAQDHLLFIAMEYLAGEDLQSLITKKGALPHARACKIMIQVCAALNSAHRRGIIHRDLKPGNIMLLKEPDESGELQDLVKVCDFGLARFLSPEEVGATPSSARLTIQGQILGTPSYMSPEQASGDDCDMRADLYSCGVILYEMLSGRLPFPEGTSMQILVKQISEVPPALSTLVPLDSSLEDIVAWAMTKDREERVQTAADLKAALQNHAEQTTTRSAGIRVTSAVPRAPKASPRQYTPATSSPIGSGSGARLDSRSRPTSASAVRQTSLVAEPEASPKRPLMRLAVSLALLAIVVGVGHFLYTTWKRHEEITHIREMLALGGGAVGTAQFTLVQELPLLLTGDDQDVEQLVKEALTKWRVFDAESVPEFFEPNYLLESSIWRGTHHGDVEQTFIIHFQEVGDYHVSGTMDWIEAGGRTAIRGVYHGGHVVFCEHEYVAGNPNAVYNERINAYIGSTKMSGRYAESRALIEAERKEN